MDVQRQRWQRWQPQGARPHVMLYVFGSLAHLRQRACRNNGNTHGRQASQLFWSNSIMARVLRPRWLWSFLNSGTISAKACPDLLE